MSGTQDGDTPARRTKKWERDPFEDWQRQIYLDSERTETMRRSEIETDKDLNKPVEQLLCDVEESYLKWKEFYADARAREGRLQLGKGAHEERFRTELFLYSLVRSTAMNAKVALDSERLQECIRTYTCWVLWLTVFVGVLAVVTTVCTVMTTCASIQRQAEAGRSGGT